MTAIKLKKNLIIYGYNRHNLGDDLMFAEIINKTSYDNYYFIGEPITPNFIAKEVGFIKRGRLMPLRWKFGADFAVIGGSVLMGVSPEQESMISQKTGWFRLNRLFRGRNFIIGANLGPYKDKNRYLRKLKKLSAVTDKWFVRDKYSIELLNNIDTNESHLMPDIVMGFDVAPYLRYKSTKQVSISLIEINKDGKGMLADENYENEIVSWVEHYVSNGYLVDLLSFEDVIDIPIIEKIKSSFPPNIQKQVRVIQNESDSVLNSIGSAEIVISTRFHCMVLAALCSKPQIIYSYSVKTLQFAMTYGFHVSEITGSITHKSPKPTSFLEEDLAGVKAYAGMVER